MTPTQFATVLFLAFVLVILLPVYRSRRRRGDKPLLSRLMGRQKDEPVPPKSAGRQARNGTKSDLLVTASMVTKAATQNKWFVIMPGFVAVNGEKATLSGIIVTRQGLIAFKCYGFGGQIIAGADGWRQVINGDERVLPDIRKDCGKQEKILSQVLARCGLEMLPLQVRAVFTTAGTDLSQADGALCLSRDGFAEFLQSGENTRDAGLNPQETGRLISPFVERQ